MRLVDRLIVMVICIVIGAVLTVQYRTVQKDFLEGLMPSKKSTQLIEELKVLREDKVTLNEKLTQLEQELAYITANSADENALVGNLQAQLDHYKILLGMVDVVGEGVLIYIDNPIVNPSDVSGNVNIVEDTHLIMMMVNELNAAGAEVISVNGERIIATTEMRQVGDHIIINGNKYINPIEIKAIGNNEVLYSAIVARFGIVEQLRQRGYQVDVSQEESLTLNKYEGSVNWRYAQPVE